MISALGKQDLVKQALLTGAKNYIVKPLDRKKVLERFQVRVGQVSGSSSGLTRAERLQGITSMSVRGG